MTEGDDSLTIAQAQAGDTVAFNRLVLRYQDTVFTLCYRLTGRPEDAADACQDAFLSAYRHIAGYRGGQFRSWLLRIAANVCHDQHRARRRRPADSLDAPHRGSDGDGAPRELADHAAGPEAEALRSELGEVLQEALGTLPEDQRLAVVLCDQHGYDYVAIAEITESELGTVKSRINRGRRKLRDFLLARRELLPESYRLTQSGDKP